jgi:pyruvate,water dikinase
VESAEPVFEIWELSRMVRQSPPLRAIFENHDPREIKERLEGKDTDEIKRFKEALAAFLTRYGYRSVFEGEVMLPSWEEDPTFIYAMIRNYLNQAEDHSPQVIQTRQGRQREQAVKEALEKLPVLKRRIFKWLLKQAQHYIALREFMKATLMMGVGHSKILFREVSRRFHEQGIIKELNDFYFLIKKEILDIMEGKPLDGSLQERVAKRKQEYEKNKQVVLPEYFEGRPKPISRRRPSFEREGVKVLKGIPLSPGRVRGRARVICDPRSAATIEPGEILVAPVTDAGWTPLFLTAAGLVVDIGGLLSHGSIVAREYGIPGVINVKIATEVIKNGQEILVDGDRGEVRILGE